LDVVIYLVEKPSPDGSGNPFAALAEKDCSGQQVPGSLKSCPKLRINTIL
jgi:hypothetical protein